MRLAGGILMSLAALAAFWFLSRDLLPPDSLRFAAGGQGGGYYRIAQAYKDILARDGIEVEVLTTAGSVENARLLADGSADVGLLQGGVATDKRLETLGNLFYEPLFVFTGNGRTVPRNPADWQGLTLAVGPDGSGTRAAYTALSGAVDLGSDANTLDPRGGAAAAAAVQAGEVDAALFVAPITAPYLEALFIADNVDLLEIGHPTALTGRLEHSDRIVLPSGAMSLRPVVPAADMPMLAMVARLGAQADLHPALVDRLVEAARELHGGRSAINADGRFPNTDRATMRPDSYARDLIRSGPSPLQDYLPYWVVAQINRFAILLLPIIFLLLPLLRTLPGLYAWRMRSRVYNYYQDIRTIEAEAEDAGADALDALDARLIRIDGELAGLSLPLPYRDYAYTARLHVDLLRRKIADRRAA